MKSGSAEKGEKASRAFRRKEEVINGAYVLRKITSLSQSNDSNEKRLVETNSKRTESDAPNRESRTLERSKVAANLIRGNNGLCNREGNTGLRRAKEGRDEQAGDAFPGDGGKHWSWAGNGSIRRDRTLREGD